MSTFELEKLLHGISTRSAWELFARDPDAGLEGRDVTLEERAALLGGDVRSLYERGLNEYLLLRYSGWIGLGGAKLTAALHGATWGHSQSAPAGGLVKDD